MTRTYKKHENRKTELLDIAQKLFYEKGYEKTTIEDIIKVAEISKGAFYHHFVSQEDLLNCLVRRISDQIVVEMRKVFEDPSIGVTQKLRKAVVTGRNIKVSHKKLLKTMLKVMYSDENLVLRYKLNATFIETIVPLYASLIEQGVKEGLFTTPSPAFTAKMMIVMGIGLQEMIWKFFADIDEKPDNIIILNEQYNLYQNSVERLLGVPEGSLEFIKQEDIHAFREEK